MAATVEIAETNGTAPGTVTNGITHTKYGNVDQVHLDPDAQPIPQSVNSFQKWQRWRLVDLGGSVRIQGLKFFTLNTPPSNTSHKFNGHTTQATYDTSKKTVYETPDQLTADTPNSVPTAEPASANIGIGGSLTGTLTAAGYSDFVVSQVQVAAAAQIGGDLSVVYQYDEVA